MGKKTVGSRKTVSGKWWWVGDESVEFVEFVGFVGLENSDG